MRARFIAVVAASAVLALTGCSSESAEPTATPTVEAADPSPEVATRGPLDPEMTDIAVIADDDQMGLEACQLWSSPIGDGDIQEIVEDVEWRADHSSNEFLSGRMGPRPEKNPQQFRIFCQWNGFEPMEGSPAEILS